MTETGCHFTKVTILDGAETSGAVEFRPFRRLAILVPSDFSGTMLVVHGSHNNVDFYPTDVVVSVTATDAWITFSSDQAEALAPLPHLRFTSDVVQTGDAVLVVAFKG